MATSPGLPISQGQSSYSTLSFTQGLLVGQLSIVLLIVFFIKFFIFGDPPNPDQIADLRATARRQRTLAHKQSLSKRHGQQQRDGGGRKRSNRRERNENGRSTINKSSSSSSSSPAPSLRKKPSTILGPLTPLVSIDTILQKTYYNVEAHQPESLDWFNVLMAQTIAQFRMDAQHGDSILASLTSVLNGPKKPQFVGDIKVTEVSLGDDFPIFSNCRVIPLNEDGFQTAWRRDGNSNLTRLQARMDVDLSDFITLGIETKLLLNYPRPLCAVLPVALSVSVVRFSGTLSISFVPTASNNSKNDGNETSPPAAAGQEQQQTTLAFSFLDDYRLDLSVRSLVGSRSRLQDVPKIAQLVEARLHAWFDERCVEPKSQHVVLPSLWRNMSGGETAVKSDEHGDGQSGTQGEEAKTQDYGMRSRRTKSGATAGLSSEGEYLMPGAMPQEA